MIGPLKPLIRTFSVARARELRAGAARLGFRVLLLVLAWILGLGGLGYLSHSLYASLANVVAPWQAGLAVGCALLALAGTLIVIVHRGAARGRRASTQAAGAEREDSATQLGRSLGRLLSRSDLHEFDLLLASLVAGIVLGARSRPRARSFDPADSRTRRMRSRANGRHGTGLRP